jgi:chlorobactene glucosyltransferase
MMLFRCEAYQEIGGYDRLGSSIIDDMLLARRITAAGLRWRVLNITDLITCRMYHGSRAALNGFAKNLFAAFDFAVLRFLFVFIWLAVMFWEPLVVLALLVLGRAPQARADELAVCVGLSLLLWLIPYFELGIPVSLALLYPITLLATEVAAFQSLCLSFAGRLTWKGRKLTRSYWKWL